MLQPLAEADIWALASALEPLHGVVSSPQASAWARLALQKAVVKGIIWEGMLGVQIKTQLLKMVAYLKVSRPHPTLKGKRRYCP